MSNPPSARSFSVAVVAVLLVIIVTVGLVMAYQAGGPSTGSSTTASSSGSSSSSTTALSTSMSSSYSTSTSTTVSAGGVIIANGTAYQVSSSFDCVAGHVAQPFNVTQSSFLVGGISATSPGVTVYVSSAQEAQSVDQGHPTMWAYTSGLTNSTSFDVLLVPGQYLVWIEGADMGCGATVVTPLEELTTVTVTQAVMLSPG